MKTNLHTHTWRCRHARGTEQEYIEAALRAGMEVLGFSDHAPMIFPDGYYSSYRMYPELASSYFDTLVDLRESYRGLIDLKIGVEMEYYPDCFQPTMEFLSDFPLDYMILGQHFTGNEIDAPYVAYRNGYAPDLAAYVDQCCTAMRMGRFTYLAHPDLFRFTGDPAIYRQEMGRLCQTAVETDTPLEVNLLGAASGRHYPNRDFWEIAAGFPINAVFGCDAHDAGELLPRPEMITWQEFLDERNIPVLTDIPLKNPW